MTYYIHIEDNKIISSGEIPMTEPFLSVEVSEELYNSFNANPDYYMWNGQNVVLNPNYEQMQAEKREEQFKKDFFETSLGYIRRKVSMKTGETKDFLTDLLPVISLAVSQNQAVNIITYKEPASWLEDVTDWESLQEYKIATPQFIQECFNQVSKDFTGI